MTFLATITFTMFLPLYVIGPTAPAERKGIIMNWLRHDCADMVTQQAGWFASGWQNENLYSCPGTEAVPILLSGHEGQQLGGNSQFLMGWNEPDLNNLEPETAAVMWHDVIEQSYPHERLIAPGISQYGIPWLVEFYNTYLGLYEHPPRLEALSIHCYGGTECIAIFQSAIALSNAWDIDGVWITEYASPACWIGLPAAIAQGRQVLDWAFSNPKVKRFAWWDNRSSWPDDPWVAPLFTSEGELTAWGWLYREF
jgi:hypothetical protein